MSEGAWISIIALACGLICQLIVLAYIAGRVTNRLEELDRTMKNGVTRKLDGLDTRTEEILQKQGQMEVRFDAHQRICLQTFQKRKPD
jgi:uncharacterized protein YoxC